LEQYLPAVPDWGDGALDKLAEAAVGNIRWAIVGAIAKKHPELDTPTVSSGEGASAGSAEVRRWVTAGLEMGKAFPATADNINKMAARAMQESSGNPLAVNDWDSNAQKGTPSKGLMQIIEPTWNSNTLPEIGMFDSNWDDPIKSAAVASRYMKAAYGHVVGATGTGYSHGGIAMTPHLGVVGDKGREAMLPLDDPRAVSHLAKAFDKSRKVRRHADDGSVMRVEQNQVSTGRGGGIRNRATDQAHRANVTVRSRGGRAQTSSVYAEPGFARTSGVTADAKHIARSIDRMRDKVVEATREDKKIARESIDDMINVVLQSTDKFMRSDRGKAAVDDAIGDKLDFDRLLKGL
jgi:SLT domain-containing protein